jgi:hypothetical protein
MAEQHTPIAVSAFECRFDGFVSTINAGSAGKARYEYLLSVRESYPDATFADIRVRKVGPAHTSAAFLRTAKYRGIPDLRCGEAVTVNERSGFVVGHNDSANFDVLFADGDWKDCVLNVHPSELRRAAIATTRQEKRS